MGYLTVEEIYDDFKSPGVYYRGKPFWSWNGKLEKDELLRQVDVLKEMGFDRHQQGWLYINLPACILS